MTNAYRRFLVLVGVACVVTIGFAMALTRYADPYWLNDARTLRDDSPALDLQMRFSKALQLISREWEVPLKVVFIGSSTVYRGLNPSALDYPAGAVYNLGISSLRMREAKAYVQHLLLFSRPETVLIGLDFFQFDGSIQTEAGFDPALGTYSTAVEMYLTSVASTNAIDGSIRALRSTPDGDGPWSRDGYKKTAPRRAGEITAQLDNALKFYQGVDTRLPAPYDHLQKIIMMLKEKGISIKLYLSPVHPRYLSAIRSAGKESQYLEWKQRVRDIAASHALPLLEIDKAHPFADAAFDGASGFNDPTHFSEWVGTMIMRSMGVPVRAVPEPKSWS